MQSEQGFTLIELLVVIAIVGILSYLGLTSFYVYRADAAYSVANSTYHNARTASESALNDLDHPPVLAASVQTVQGPISDAATRSYLPGMQMPKNTRIEARYDPTCIAGACESEFIEVRHCLGNEYVQWTRLGDGVEVFLPSLSGSGCAP